MKKILIFTAVLAQLFVSCNSKKQTETDETIKRDSIENQIEKQETDNILVFEGSLPCADCAGIETILRINRLSNKYELSTIYKGKSPERTFKEKGNLNTERGLENDPDGTIYVLNWDKPQNEQTYYGYFSKNPEKIYMLDRNKKVIKSKLDYSLELNE
ncbi:copper resistance protein NlpE N-terminal domain-containing protein [Flavobacterium johnsoniae]|uniref:copper resistance protein NlpE n=1 Tax=Flavobacterium johnsoniae TaxID=986 RepID=UPI0025B2692D|nr:copper resistance protein NlpE N-terminal domain-containing protein [Flavobacterium johnsoniae]WJS94012.1 copper resistance protein NlpE N-terminal domain-containing protein [Flavobacterium johnsoniae]